MMLRDIQYAARSLRSELGMSVATIVTLALGIGANVTMFRVIEHLLLSPPPHVRSPNDVRRVFFTRLTDGGAASAVAETSYPVFASLNAPSRGHLDGVAAYFSSTLAVGRDEAARPVRATLVTGAFFSVLGVRPALGRLLEPTDDHPPHGTAVAVVSERLARALYATPNEALGKVIPIGARPFTIVGVAPRGFRGTDYGEVDLWVPLSSAAAAIVGANWDLRHGLRWLRLIIRMPAGAAPARVSEVVARSVFGDARASNASDAGAASRVLLTSIVPGRGPGKSPEVLIAILLTAVSAIVLAIACINVANINLTRAIKRRREIAVRVALGISPSQLLREALVHSGLLTAFGSSGALFVSYAGTRTLVALLLPEGGSTVAPATGPLFVYTASIAVAVTAATGLIPALSTRTICPSEALKSASRSPQILGLRVREMFVVVQVALCVVLLVGTGLFVRSLWNASSLDLGFDAQRLAIVSFRQDATDEPKVIDKLYREAAERLRASGVVESVSLSTTVPFVSSTTRYMSVPGADSIPQLVASGADVNAVSHEYFATLGTQVRKGRAFEPADEGRDRRVAIVNERFAALVWAGRDPIAQCLKIGGPSASCSRVVGVVEDARQYGVREQPVPQVFVPLQPMLADVALRAMLVRTWSSTSPPTAGIRAAVRGAVPSTAYAEVVLFSGLLESQLRPWRVGTRLFAILCVIAFVLAILGLYTVLAFNVAQRTHELGTRLALGARPADIVWMTVHAALRPAVAGCVLGVAAAWAGSRFIAGMLFNISHTDPLVYLATPICVVSVCLVASYLPARTAARVNPAKALGVRN